MSNDYQILEAEDSTGPKRVTRPRVSTPVPGRSGLFNDPVRTGKYSHPSKQARSRKSFDRVLAVATELLEKHGFNGFSIVDVSRRSKISIGSIYGRVTGKDDLVRSVQERVLNNADREHDAFLQNLDHEGMTLRELFPLAVQYHADFLARHAAIFHAFISRASNDPVLRARGKRRTLLHKRSVQAVAASSPGDHAPDPDRAVLACTRLMWSSFGSFLGIESDESAGEGDWQELIEDVTQMGLFYLLLKDRRIFESSAEIKNLVGASVNS